jgi:hypothetical protein
LNPWCISFRLFDSHPKMALRHLIVCPDLLIFCVGPGRSDAKSGQNRSGFQQFRVGWQTGIGTNVEAW